MTDVAWLCFRGSARRHHGFLSLASQWPPGSRPPGRVGARDQTRRLPPRRAPGRPQGAPVLPPRHEWSDRFHRISEALASLFKSRRSRRSRRSTRIPGIPVLRVPSAPRLVHHGEADWLCVPPATEFRPRASPPQYSAPAAHNAPTLRPGARHIALYLTRFVITPPERQQILAPPCEEYHSVLLSRRP